MIICTKEDRRETEWERERASKKKNKEQQWKHAKLKYNEFPDSSSQNIIMIEVVKIAAPDEKEEEEANTAGKW